MINFFWEPHNEGFILLDPGERAPAPEDKGMVDG